MSTPLALLPDVESAISPRGSPETLARQFCESVPHRASPYNRRNWGGRLHSFCSYQGKLKPAIAHFLVAWFTKPGDRVLDPMAGVGTIPLEARRQGRTAIANDMSPLAASVATAKLEPFEPKDVVSVFDELARAIEGGPSLKQLAEAVDVEFGLNGAIGDYFHPDTLREILIARAFLLATPIPSTAATEIVRSSLMHILHGNRPYALSRRSHPVTPFAPAGEFRYRPLLAHLETRLGQVVPHLLLLQDHSLPGEAYAQDFRKLAIDQVDAVITSPPFAKSLRFWSMNWMRLWFAGWDPADFRSMPAHFLESQQRVSFEPYGEFADAMGRLLKPGGLMIMHLGETAGTRMVDEIVPRLGDAFEVLHLGREGVEDTESHGLTDKGATLAHWYLFAARR